MVARIKTIAFQGIEVLLIDVQVHLSEGLPAFHVVGLPDKAVAESRERVRAALHAIGLALPPKRITVNLAPADVQKEGSHYDLPIAVGLLAVMNVVPASELSNFIILGELALDGSITSVAGALPSAVEASSRGLGIICPMACGGEAAWAGDLDVLAPSNLLSLINHFKGIQVLSRPEPKISETALTHIDMADIKGQETSKRALEVAAAGGHNLLMMGPPGAGKSMLAARLPGLLPPLDPAEALEVTMIHSLAGQLKDGKLLRERPFRDPHHSASLPALVGGGLRAQPGEISLAHQGVLFLDELPEFARSTLEALRQPLESGKVTVARASAHITYPSRFQFVAAMNPCRCGYMGDLERSCTRAPRCGQDYQSRISGPLLDRMDIHVEVEAVKATDLYTQLQGESTSTVAARVAKARAIQTERFANLGGPEILRSNAQAQGKVLEEMIEMDHESQALVTEAANRWKLSARAYHRLLKVARTIADLDTSSLIRPHHMAEALSYRRINVR